MINRVKNIITNKKSMKLKVLLLLIGSTLLLNDTTMAKELDTELPIDNKNVISNVSVATLNDSTRYILSEDRTKDIAANILNEKGVPNLLLPNQKEVKTVETTEAPKEIIQEVKSVQKQTVKQPEKNYYEVTVSATAYTAYCNGCSGITATGINLRKNPNMKVIAVDPNVIPLGSKVYVPGYGEAIAGDKGGAIKGNKIDVFISTKQAAYNWGRKTVTVKVYK